MKKPDPRSVLKTLPAALQAELYEYLRAHSVKKTRLWIAERGVQIGEKALARFYKWYPLTINPLTAEQLQDLLERNGAADPAISTGQLEMIAAQHFVVQSLLHSDSQLFLTMRRLQLRRRLGSGAERDHDPRQACRRFQQAASTLLYDWYADPRVQTIAATAGTRVEKIEALARLLFGVAWERPREQTVSMAIK